MQVVVGFGSLPYPRLEGMVYLNYNTPALGPTGIMLDVYCNVGFFTVEGSAIILADGGLRMFHLSGKGSIGLPFTSQSISGEITAAYKPAAGASLLVAIDTPFAAAAMQLAYHDSALKVNSSSWSRFTALLLPSPRTF